MAETGSTDLHPELDGWLAVHGASVADLAQWTGMAEHKLAPAWRQCFHQLHDADCLRGLEEMVILHVPVELTALVPFVCNARNGSGRWSLQRSLALFNYPDIGAAEQHAPGKLVGCQFCIPHGQVGEGILAACKSHGLDLDHSDPGIARISVSLMSGGLDARRDLLSTLFAELLTYSRPVARYSATFYLELDFRHPGPNPGQAGAPKLVPSARRSGDPRPGSSGADGDERRADSSGAVDARQFDEAVRQAFRQSLHPFVMDSADSRGAGAVRHGIEEWVAPVDRSTGWQLVAVTRRMAGDSRRSLTEKMVADVTGVRLISLPHYSTALLAVTVAPATPAWSETDADSVAGLSQATTPATSDQSAETASGCSRSGAIDDINPWWYRLVFGEPRFFQWVRSRQLSRWMRFTQDARSLNDSFTGQAPQNRIYLCPPSDRAAAGAEDSPVAERAAGQALEVLAGMVLARRPEASTDDGLFVDAAIRTSGRLFVHVDYGVAGPRILDQRLRRLTARAAFVDLPGDAGLSDAGLVYFSPLAQECMSQWSFDRRCDDGVLYAFTDTCNAYVASGDPIGNQLTSSCVPVFERSVVYALSLRTILHQFLRRLNAVSALVDAPVSASADSPGHWMDELNNIRRAFRELTDNFWFPVVSRQPDLQQIGRLQQSGLNLQALHEQVRTELRRLGAI